MADLVTLNELKSFLGDAVATDDTVLQALVDHVEGLFESECGRSATPFGPAQASRTEVKDASGAPPLYLDYPIASLTSVKLGYDPATPDETLDVSSKRVVTFSAGSRHITRTDGGRFGCVGQPNYVQVVYATQADLPEDAQIAIKRACALIYRQRGSEDVQSEVVGGFYEREMAKFGRDFVGDDPIWRMAVNAHRRMVLA